LPGGGGEQKGKKKTGNESAPKKQTFRANVTDAATEWGGPNYNSTSSLGREKEASSQFTGNCSGI